MRTRYLIAGLVVVMALSGVLIYRSNNQQSAAVGGQLVTITHTVDAPSTPRPSSGAGASASTQTRSLTTTTQPSQRGQSAPQTTTTTLPSPQNSTASSPAGRPASNIPMTKLKPGQKPPQFIIFSIDGSGNHRRWQDFMAAAAPTNSRFVAFLTGLYLLGDPGKMSYTGPGHSRGKASIGFGGPQSDIVTEVKDLNQAYSRGHEIGTHYNGHFCAGDDPSGAAWSTADWNSELDQFFHFLTNWQQLNGYQSVPALRVPVTSIKGGRTPCLEGKWDQLVPAWKAHGMTYDSSMPAPYTGIAWPTQRDGIWDFPMPTVYSPGFKDTVMAMDFNFWVKFNGAKDQPGTAAQVRAKVAQTYQYMYDRAFAGNRAPVLISNHFNTWNGDSFNPPALDFTRSTCGRPDTFCTTYSDVIAWMRLQDPPVLARLQAMAPVADSNAH